MIMIITQSAHCIKRSGGINNIYEPIELSNGRFINTYRWDIKKYIIYEIDICCWKISCVRAFLFTFGLKDCVCVYVSFFISTKWKGFIIYLTSHNFIFIYNFLFFLHFHCLPLFFCYLFNFFSFFYYSSINLQHNDDQQWQHIKPMVNNNNNKKNGIKMSYSISTCNI